MALIPTIARTAIPADTPSLMSASGDERGAARLVDATSIENVQAP